MEPPISPLTPTKRMAGRLKNKNSYIFPRENLTDKGIMFSWYFIDKFNEKLLEFLSLLAMSSDNLFHLGSFPKLRALIDAFDKNDIRHFRHVV